MLSLNGFVDLQNIGLEPKSSSILINRLKFSGHLNMVILALLMNLLRLIITLYHDQFKLYPIGPDEQNY